jgi:hypothetical protein
MLHALGAPGRALRRQIGLIVGLLVVAVVVGVVYTRFAPTSAPQAGPGADVLASTEPNVFATGPVSLTTPPDGPTSASSGPFAGTPAAAWPAGQTGVTIPAPAEVAGFSAQDVAADLSTVRLALIAARLDPRMLVNHDPSALAALLAPDDWAILRHTFAADRLGMVTLLDSDVRLSQDLPRVNGEMSYESTIDPTGRRVLQVDTNYVWAYAFDNGQVGVVHDVIVWWFFRSSDVAVTSRGPWVYSSQSYGVNVDCDRLDHARLAPAVTASGAPVAGDDPNGYWDPQHSMDDPAPCDHP